ncbi:MAG: hypothetical protein IEMM0008_0287 [bacterium]|nr:MAG: hypothetical protein IEMM0008_0287 [bacterium]
MSKIPLLFSIVLVISLSLHCSDQLKNQKPSSLIPSELDFSKEFVQRLQKNGITVIEVKSSVEGALFKRTPNKAVWIKTKQGILDVVFFQKPFKNNLIIAYDKLNGKNGRYKYIIADYQRKTKSPIINANRPLYFIIYDNIFIVTDNLKLSKSLKLILLGDRIGVWG